MVPGHPHQLMGTAGGSRGSLGCEKTTLGASWDASGAPFHTLSEPSGEPWSDPCDAKWHLRTSFFNVFFNVQKQQLIS